MIADCSWYGMGFTCLIRNRGIKMEVLLARMEGDFAVIEIRVLIKALSKFGIVFSYKAVIKQFPGVRLALS